MTDVYDDGNSSLVLSVGPYPDLLLTGQTTTVDGVTFSIDALADDVSWGSPQPIDVAVQRWMTDGAVAATQGHENRELTFKVVVSASESVALAAAEAALVLRSGQSGLLGWVPAEGSPDAPTTVFELWTMHLEHQFDDDDEFQLQRTYLVTITAKPWARSANLTMRTAPVPPATSTTLEVDTCTSTSGWTASSAGPTVVGGALKATTPVPAGGSKSLLIVGLTRTGAVTGLDATPYIMLDYTTAGGAVPAAILWLDGQPCSKAAQLGTVSYWHVPAGMTSFNVLNLTVFIQTTNKGGNVSLTLADVARTDTIGGIGSRKQLARSIDVGGSVKTSGSIHVASPTGAALGSCLVYTAADDASGFSPPMRQYRYAGNTVTPDASCVSGNHEAYVNNGASVGVINYALPRGAIREGNYTVVGRFIFGAAATMTVSVSGMLEDGSNPQTIASKVTASGAGPAWGVIGALTLPPAALAEGSQVGVVVQTAATATGGTHFLDELYLFDVTNGSFTLMVGNPSSQLWIDAPDVDTVRNRPAIYIGSQANRSDAYTPNSSTIRSVGVHDLPPDGAKLFTVTDTCDNAAVDVSFYRRWHTHSGN
jgi:hypothetical protein